MIHLPSIGIVFGMMMMLAPFFSLNAKITATIGSVVLIGLCLRKAFKVPETENPAILDLGHRIDKVIQLEIP